MVSLNGLLLFQRYMVDGVIYQIARTIKSRQKIIIYTGRHTRANARLEFICKSQI
jgi:hypothetical protein